MNITGVHTVTDSTDPDTDRAFLRDVLKLTHVDVGDGWLIFGLLPAEVAVHPADANDQHEFHLMCDDIKGLTAALRERGLSCDPVNDAGWGLLSRLSVPGGGKLGIYALQHARPERMGSSEPAVRSGQASGG